MTDSLQSLKIRMIRFVRLAQTLGLLDWDQQTYMPTGAATARAEQSAALAELLHETLSANETGELLAQAEADLAAADPDSDDLRLLAVVRRDYDRATKLPADLVAEMARHSALAQDLWLRARPGNDFASFAPALNTMFGLVKRQADYLGYTDHPYDALLNLYEPGANQSDVAAMFTDLKPQLIDLARRIAGSSQPVDDAVLHGSFDTARQHDVTLSVIKQIGFDLQRGRQDVAAHPFCGGSSGDDVRITTRFDARYIGMALYASLHEAGHGLYEQGIPRELDGSPLGAAPSLGVHESQSRLWENLIGRSRPFCSYLLPVLGEAFPEAFDGVSEETLYRAVNKVTPSLIRVEADEVTYNLHVMLRFELECALLTGDLGVDDLPHEWNARMNEYLGVTPPNDSDGVLQDIHWANGLIGYFPTYTIGNLLSAQLLHAARKALPDLDAHVRAAEFAPLLDWLRANVHRHGRKYLPDELTRKATGKPLTPMYYVDYLTQKYTEIYVL